MSENSKSKKALISALAIGLAAIMTIGGGTFAYLQGETEEVKNDFKRNKVMVELAETKGPNFEIIPGMSDEKDPKVTVDNTVDAYAYVEITDATAGLVTYEIADGWTKLNGYDNVYYREVAKDAAVKEFSVLKNDTVSYDASLTNTDMVDADGNLKENVALTFKAYAIQKAPFNDVVKAYRQLSSDVVTTSDGILESIANGKSVKLESDVNVTSPENTEYNMADGAVLDLNEKTLTSPYMTTIIQGKDVVIKNGNIASRADYSLFIGNGTKDTTVTVEDVKLDGGINVFVADVVLKNVTVDAASKNYYAVWADEAATITIESGTYIAPEGKSAVNASSLGSVVIKGGTFSSDVSAYVADGYKVVANADSTYSVVKA